METSGKGKKVWAAVALSLVPGLSLLYIGRWKKTIALFVIDAGIILTLVLSSSYLAKLIALNIYFFTALAPLIESYQVARYGRNTIDSDSRWYVAVLLLTTGFNALPLLWQSGAFSRRAKIAWSVAVPVLAGLFVLFLARYWNEAEALLRTVLNG
ncbi:MAG: hypothetical protein GF408_05280 [Candidatus Omnitrophica bacterium]|nr:hypothetical protein [Candidatus Omnitrophota bacterium]